MTCDVTVEGSSLGCFFKYSTTTGCTCTSLHSSRARWHLCYWGRPVLPLVCNASAQAAWSCLCCFHSGSICELLNRPIWNNYRNTGRVKTLKLFSLNSSPRRRGGCWLTLMPEGRWLGSRHRWRPLTHGLAGPWPCSGGSPHLRPPPSGLRGYLNTDMNELDWHNPTICHSVWANP